MSDEALRWRKWGRHQCWGCACRSGTSAPDNYRNRPSLRQPSGLPFKALAGSLGYVALLPFSSCLCCAALPLMLAFAPTPSLTKQTSRTSWPEKHTSCLALVALRGASAASFAPAFFIVVLRSTLPLSVLPVSAYDVLLPLPGELFRRAWPWMDYVETVLYAHLPSMTVKDFQILARRRTKVTNRIMSRTKRAPIVQCFDPQGYTTHVDLPWSWLRGCGGVLK